MRIGGGEPPCFKEAIRSAILDFFGSVASGVEAVAPSTAGAEGVDGGSTAVSGASEEPGGGEMGRSVSFCPVPAAGAGTAAGVVGADHLPTAGDLGAGDAAADCAFILAMRSATLGRLEAPSAEAGVAGASEEAGLTGVLSLAFKAAIRSLILIGDDSMGLKLIDML